jgi:hypothetical protein
MVAFSRRLRPEIAIDSWREERPEMGAWRDTSVL